MKQTATKEPMLTLKEAMSYLKCSRSTVYRLMWDGTLQGQKIRNSWRFDQGDLRNCIEPHGIAKQPSLSSAKS